MGRKKKISYSLEDSLDILNRLQQMAISEENLSIALKAEELKCKILLAQTDDNCGAENDSDITKILVDFINDKQNSKNTADICTADTDKEAL